MRTQEIEIWKDVIGFENLYQVSNMGRVKSLGNDKTKKEKILKQEKINNGYYQVILCKEGKRKNYYVHRLVCQAFIPNPDNLSTINHKNESKTDNRVENLMWCTQKYNINYGTHNERVAKARQKPIVQLTKNNEFIKKWDSATQASKELGIYQQSICRCCKGKLKTCSGFKWVYVKEYYNARTLNRMRDIFTKLLELKQVS